MNNPVNMSDGPFPVEVQGGNSYFICTCGQSQNRPLCDGSHAGTEHRPVKYEAIESKGVFFCGCAKSSTHPLCDGSHSL